MQGKQIERVYATHGEKKVFGIKAMVNGILPSLQATHNEVSFIEIATATSAPQPVLHLLHYFFSVYYSSSDYFTA